MTDERSPDAGLWAEEDEREDDEQTQVARNPLLVGPPSTEAPSAQGDARRPLSVFGTPKGGKRGSLLDRLTEAGTLEEVMALDKEVSRQSQLPRALESFAAPGAHAEDMELDAPFASMEAAAADAAERDEPLMAPLPPAAAPARLQRTPTDLAPTPVARVPTVRRVVDSVREVNSLHDPRREPDDVEVSRPSSVPLRDSDLDFVSEDRPIGSASGNAEVSFVSALAQDPDVDEPPVVARFKRPPELPRNPASLPPPAAVTPARGAALSGGASAAPPALPSMMVAGAAARVRSDTTPTERLSTHPINHSTAPTSAPKTERPQERRGTGGLWLGVAAAVLVGLGLAALSRYRDQESQAEPQALAQPGLGSMVVEAQPAEAPVEPAAPAPAAPATAAPAPAPVAPAVEAAPAAKADTTEASAEEQARAEERERRRRERHEARAAAAAQASGEGATPAAADSQAATAAPAPAAGATTPAAPRPADGTLQAQPTRDQVVAAMNAVLPRLQECVGDKHGQANVTITVRAAGFVSYAIVGGTFVGTPEGSCIARVVKEAQFPPFAEPFIRITYPYQL